MGKNQNFIKVHLIYAQMPANSLRSGGIALKLKQHMDFMT